jgi:hypothetical protein
MTPAFFAYFIIAAFVFVPIFGIAFFMLKSARRAFGIASVFALGSVFGFFVAGELAGLIVGRDAGPDLRNVYGIAFATGGAVAGGVLAVWLLTRKTGIRP